MINQHPQGCNLGGMTMGELEELEDELKQVRRIPGAVPGTLLAAAGLPWALGQPGLRHLSPA